MSSAIYSFKSVENSFKNVVNKVKSSNSFKKVVKSINNVDSTYGVNSLKSATDTR